MINDLKDRLAVLKHLFTEKEFNRMINIIQHYEKMGENEVTDRAIMTVSEHRALLRSDRKIKNIKEILKSGDTSRQMIQDILFVVNEQR